MYYYLVDPKEYDGKNFEYHQTRLLSLIGEYQIAGEMARVTKLRTIEDLVHTALSHGVTTLVVVGGDESFARVTSACQGKPVTLGYIPINTRSELAKILGVRDLSDAVATIAKRRVETLDVAKIGSTSFISSLEFGTPEIVVRAAGSEGIWGSFKKWLNAAAIPVTLRLDGSFQVTVSVLAGSIVNARDNRWYRYQSRRPMTVGNPKDQRLDVTLAGKLSAWSAWRYRAALAHGYYEAVPGGSILHARRIELIAPDGLPLYLAGLVVARAPAVIEMTKSVVRVVVGKDRQF